jgi:DNA-directed RNA polymerase subunit M/transcription elongation factor TFIIS
MVATPTPSKPCPKCFTGKAVPRAVTAKDEQRIITYVCDCGHRWNVTVASPST